MEIRRVLRVFQVIWAALAFIACSGLAVAQAGHTHGAPQNDAALSSAASHEPTLLQVVREATERYRDVAVAEADGYVLTFGCVQGPDSGAMGLHFVNFSLVASGILDARKPQIVIYEPTPDGKMKLIGADFLVIASQWDAAHPGNPPQLMGQLFHYFESPNRFGLPAFYTLHVWAWKENPNGAFVNWHPNVSCQSFTAQ
jgi:hypothetical protein